MAEGRFLVACLLASAALSATGCVTSTPTPAAADASVSEGGTRDGGVCPDPLPSFVPVLRPPTGKKQNRCSDDDVAALVDACLGPQKAKPACDAEKTKRVDCTKCMFTEDTAPAWGPVIHFAAWGDATGVNWAGCLALVDGQTGGGDGGRSCPETANAYATCPYARCAGCFGSVQTQCTNNAYAPESPCKPFERELQVCLSKESVPAPDLATACGISSPSPDVAEWFRRVSRTFCGG